MFRDSLRIDPEAFEKYVNLKKEAASKYRYDPQAYTDAKSARVMEFSISALRYPEYEHVK